MEVRLIIALDDECQIYQTLMQGDLKEIDTYMVSHYEDSKELRKDPKLSSTIETFLQEHQSYRDACSRQNNGYIKLVYTDETGHFCPLKAYYKKDKEKVNVRLLKAKIKRDSTSDIKLLRLVCNQYQTMMSEFARDEIAYNIRHHRPVRYAAFFNNWIERVSQRENGYFVLRQMNRLIEKYQEQQAKVQQKIPIRGGKIGQISEEEFEQEMVLCEPEESIVRCVKAVEDPDELFSSLDLDDLAHREPEDIPNHVKLKKN